MNGRYIINAAFCIIKLAVGYEGRIGHMLFISHMRIVYSVAGPEFIGM